MDPNSLERLCQDIRHRYTARLAIFGIGSFYSNRADGGKFTLLPAQRKHLRFPKARMKAVMTTGLRYRTQYASQRASSSSVKNRVPSVVLSKQPDLFHRFSLALPHSWPW